MPQTGDAQFYLGAGFIDTSEQWGFRAFGCEGLQWTLRSCDQRGRRDHAELGSRFRQAIQPTTIDSVATTSGATPCPYSPWRVTVASAANITVQPSAAPHSRVRACASRTAVVSSSDPVTKWNHGGYPQRRYSS